MKVLTGFIGTIMIGFMMCGCSYLIMPPSESTPESQPPPPSHGGFNDRMRDLASQLDKNSMGNSRLGTYIVTSFTSLDKLNETNELGRLIAENLMHGLQAHKWQIIEIRLTKDIELSPDGEFTLSRDMAKLKEEYNVTGIVTGTYSMAEGNITINARVIDISSGLLLSSAQEYVPTRGLSHVFLPKETGNSTMKIVSDGVK